MTARPTRREVLAGLGTLTVGAGAGVALGSRGTGGSAASPSARPSVAGSGGASGGAPSAPSTGPIDERVANALKHEDVNAAFWQALAEASPKNLKGLPLDQVAADHALHVEALIAIAQSAAPGLPALSSNAPAPNPRGVTAPDLRARERRSSEFYVGLAAGASGDLAGLFASIAASNAVHAELLGTVRTAS